MMRSGSHHLETRSVKNATQVEIGVPSLGTAFVRRRADRRRVIQNLEECARDVATGLVETVEH